MECANILRSLQSIMSLVIAIVSVDVIRGFTEHSGDPESASMGSVYGKCFAIAACIMLLYYISMDCESK